MCVQPQGRCGGVRQGIDVPGRVAHGGQTTILSPRPTSIAWRSLGRCLTERAFLDGWSLRSVGVAQPLRVWGPDLQSRPCPCRDIAKNALLRWRVFVYWTFLGVFDALVFFFGAYFMFENTTVTSNGQVSTEPVRLVGWAAWGSHTGVGRVVCGAGPGASGHQSAPRPRRLCSCWTHPSRAPGWRDSAASSCSWAGPCRSIAQA